ncbi:unnamed protein product [Amoebophrya sp. A120]|nr:unnamed protein product [Amoebophrya sp. A120]|eukprot:GSA120T00015635001.1
MFDDATPKAPQMTVFGLSADIPLVPPAMLVLLNLFCGLVLTRILKWRAPLFQPSDDDKKERKNQWSFLFSGFDKWKKRLPFSLLGFLLIAAWFYECHLSLKAAGSGIPFTPVQGITTVGSYKYSRNPLYVMALTCFIPWIALLVNSKKPLLVTLPGMFLYLHFVVIPAEEKFLMQNHPAAYEKYFATVPRWVFF